MAEMLACVLMLEYHFIVFLPYCFVDYRRIQGLELSAADRHGSQFDSVSFCQCHIIDSYFQES